MEVALVEYIADNIKLSPDIQNEISEFLTKKRKDIVYCLAEHKKLSHGALADAIGTSAASLSNILMKFEMFKYKLLDSSSLGKYRYYFLTELGSAYVERCSADEKIIESEKLVQHELLQLMEGAKGCLEKFQGMYEDDWELELDNALIARINYCGPFDGKGDLLVDEFLESIEKVMLFDDESLPEKILKLLSCNSILRGRLVIFMEKFTPFCCLLEVLGKEEHILQIYEVLESIVENDVETAKNNAKEIGLMDEYDSLSNAVLEIINHTKNQSIEHIYGCFCRYLAGNKALAAFLAKVVEKNTKTS